MQSIHIINRNGANVSSSTTLATMSNELVSHYSGRIINFMFLKCIILAITVTLERPYTKIIYSIFRLCMELNAIKKSINNCVALSFPFFLQ